LSIVNVVLGVLAATIMPNHAAFMHRDQSVWIALYMLDILHGLFMYVPCVCDPSDMSVCMLYAW